MLDRDKKKVETKLKLIEKTVNEIRILLSGREAIQSFTTDDGTLMVPRRVSFCEHCGEIKEEIGYVAVDEDAYKRDKNCIPDVTWCFSCGDGFR